MRNAIERAVQLCLGEQERYARERQKQLRRKSPEYFGERQSSESHANDPRQDDRQYANIEFCRKTHQNC